jgi:predicted MFS family arabinose efflux permease
MSFRSAYRIPFPLARALTTQIASPPIFANRRAALAIGGLGMTQIIGWGTAFSPITIFGTVMGEELGMAREVVFSGITLMLLVSAALAPRIGRIVDHRGARPVMMVGSVIATLAMLAMWAAHGYVSYYFAWVLIGIAMPMMLSNTALPGVVQVVGSNARRAITALMLINGLTSTVALPACAWLQARIGWRDSYLIFAALHIFVCLPIHALVLRRPSGDVSTPYGSSSAPPAEGVLPPERRRAAFVMLALWACTEGLITWGLYMQVIDVFKELGLSGVAAVALWSLVGPAQASARFTDLVFGGRYSIFAVALASASLTSLSFMFLLPFGLTLTTTALFCLCLGVGHGLYAVGRNTLPLILFGAKQYGYYMGLLMVPQNIVNAASPIIFAAAISRVHPAAALVLAGVGAVTGFAAVVALIRACRGHGAVHPG